MKSIHQTLTKINTPARNNRGLSAELAGDILGGEWGVSYCGKAPLPGRESIEVRHNGERASFHGTTTCRSVWTCPVCAARITAGRRGEIEQIMSGAAGEGLRGLFLTVTIQHNRASRLDALLDALLDAWRGVFSGDKTGERRCLAAVKGQIKTLEIRYGRNGFHPHLHVLLLVDESGLDDSGAALLEEEIAGVCYRRYARKVEARGMVAAREAYDARAAVLSSQKVAHYITKIENNIAAELANGEGKSGARSFTMFQLLALYERGEREQYGREIAEVFREYARATKGRRMISYSRGIKAYIVDKTDEELAAEGEAAELASAPVVLAIIPLPLWAVICERRLRFALLEVADSGDARRVQGFLDAIVKSVITPYAVKQ